MSNSSPEFEKLRSENARLISYINWSTNELNNILKDINKKLRKASVQSVPCLKCDRFTICLNSGFECPKIEAWRRLHSPSSEASL